MNYMRKDRLLMQPVDWAGNHSEVEKIVELASRLQVALIPFGGGTSVSGALLCPEEESRMIVSLDTSQMVSNYWTLKITCTSSVDTLHSHMTSLDCSAHLL